jgi:hypothetical protein
MNFCRQLETKVSRVFAKQHVAISILCSIFGCDILEQYLQLSNLSRSRIVASDNTLFGDDFVFYLGLRECRC